MKDQLAYRFNFSNVFDYMDHNVLEKVQYLSEKKLTPLKKVKLKE